MRIPLPTFESFSVNEERENQDVFIDLALGFWSKDMPDIIKNLDAKKADYTVTNKGVLVKDFKSIVTDPNELKSRNGYPIEGNFETNSVTHTKTLRIVNSKIDKTDDVKLKSACKKAVEVVNKRNPDYVPTLKLNNVTIEKNMEMGEEVKTLVTEISATIPVLGGDKDVSLAFGQLSADFYAEVLKSLK